MNILQVRVLPQELYTIRDKDNTTKYAFDIDSNQLPDAIVSLFDLYFRTQAVSSRYKYDYKPDDARYTVIFTPGGIEKIIGSYNAVDDIPLIQNGENRITDSVTFHRTIMYSSLSEIQKESISHFADDIVRMVNSIESNFAGNSKFSNNLENIVVYTINNM